MSTNYRTILKNGTHEIEIKKSRFITNLARVSDESAAKDFIAQVKKEHYKANHNCSAFLIGPKNEIQRANDDGEPSGTAGIPMLESLKLMNLKNIVAVTTRYFGGTKLGAGGLIRAYSNGVSEAAHAIGIVRGTLQKALKFSLAYNQLDLVQNHFKDVSYNLDELEYGTDIQVTSYIDTDHIEEIQTALTELLSGQIQFEIGEERYREVLIQN